MVYSEEVLSASIHICPVGDIEKTVVVQVSITQAQRKLHAPAAMLVKRQSIACVYTDIEQGRIRVTVLIAVSAAFFGIVISSYAHLCAPANQPSTRSNQ